MSEPQPPTPPMPAMPIEAPEGADSGPPAFSFRTRQRAIERFRSEEFDLLVVGGGITGAAVARDAVSRGLTIALVERGDFASGTSSRSSKLIHGGLRYLENMEFRLVFEALSERALLLRTAPHLVRPLRFFLPVYEGDSHGGTILSLGLWLYDLLALFRAPGFHRRLSRKRLLSRIPFLRQEGLKGGFEYFDASMWDDALVIETLRSVAARRAAIASYCEACEPLWSVEDGDGEGARIRGFTVRDALDPAASPIELRARRVVICAGPWTDQLGSRLSSEWRSWLAPSRGAHLIFDLKRLPVPGALVMSHPSDGRISFVIPRVDLGSGVVIVGTTDGPSPADPDKVTIEPEDVDYLMDLLHRYFPELRLGTGDILSAYVGVRPLMGRISGQWEGRRLEGGSGPGPGPGPSGGGDGNLHAASSASESLRRISREHHIGLGPGGVTVVVGGKYTTHRRMAEEIVDFTLREWKKDEARGRASALPGRIGRSATREPVNPRARPETWSRTLREARGRGIGLPRELAERHGLDALVIWDLARRTPPADRLAPGQEDPDGFPMLLGQLRFAIRHEMTLNLADFYFRRTPLYAARADHGLPWAEALAKVWAEERGLEVREGRAELERLQEEIARRGSWRTRV